MDRLEYCCVRGCEQPTGRAGRGDDSIYCDVCDAGPYCSECWKDHEHNFEARAAREEKR